MKATRFWNLYAPVYNVFMSMNKNAYAEVYKKIRKTIQNKKVLELACGTGLISNHVAEVSKTYIATDFAENMLFQAQRKKSCENLRYMKANAENLPFENHSFDVVIISNALHIMPNPEKVLAEIQRVLKTGGILIAPTFVHENLNSTGQMLVRMLTVAGITQSNWNMQEYLDFLKQNHVSVKKKTLLKGVIPLLYTEGVYR